MNLLPEDISMYMKRGISLIKRVLWLDRWSHRTFMLGRNPLWRPMYTKRTPLWMKSITAKHKQNLKRTRCKRIRERAETDPWWKLMFARSEVHRGSCRAEKRKWRGQHLCHASDALRKTLQTIQVSFYRNITPLEWGKPGNRTYTRYYRVYTTSPIVLVE